MVKELNISIKLTNLAIKNIEKLFGIESNPHQYKGAELLTDLLEDAFYDCYLQNATRDESRDIKVRILMAGDTSNRFNKKFINNHDEKILALEGVNIDENKFLVTCVKLIHKNVGTHSNKSIFAKIKFYSKSDIKAMCIPEDIMEQIAFMPNAQELYKKVYKNIKDWDKYLEIIENEAKNSQVELKYIGFKQEDSLTHCTFKFKTFNSEEITKLKKFRNERVILFYTKINENEDTVNWENIEDFIGVIDEINLKNHTIKIELEPEFQELAVEGELDFPQKANLRISKGGDLAQARNLRRGLNLLKTGQANNPDLDIILFNSKTLGENIEGNVVLTKENLLLSTLNSKQKLAVEGALNAKDLFLIQGPPGTGKTTVIAEICYQNAIRGKKTLISSQTNLAVDNALSRLVHNPKIRILRRGNVSRVEKEGEKYTEENVVDTWLGKTAESCKNEFGEKENLLEELNRLYYKADNISYLYSRKEELKESIKVTNEVLDTNNKKLLQLDTLKNKLDLYFKDIENEIWKNYTIGSEKKLLSILKEVDEILLIECATDIEEQLVSNKIYEDFEDIYKIINEELKLKNIKENNKNQILKNLEVIAKIKSSIASKQIEIAKNNLSKLSEVEAEPLNKHISLISEKNKKILDIKRLIASLIDIDKTVEESIGLLKSLKKDYKINDIIVPKESINENIEIEVIAKFQNEVANIYNYKPNKFMSALGFNKKWKVKVIRTMNLGVRYTSYIKEKIDQLNIKCSEYENVLKERINELLDLLNMFDSNYNNTLSGVYKEINLNIEKLINLKNDYLAIKVNKLEEIDAISLAYNDILSINKLSLDKEMNEVDSILDEIETYNNDIEKILNTKINKNEMYKKKDIKEYYTDLLRNKRDITKNYVDIVKEWITRIDEKKYGDKSELKDLYINTANVIGITCVQSASKNFSENYPDFDVVIVDEVSKATPPELVLPMLKGKKSVLVGDHKQLPPMIGAETFEELKSMNDEVALDSEMEDLEYMKKSLFEELFGNVNEKNKVMLDTQYRMHSSIMNTINQFYIEHDNDGLKCGIENEEENKKHKIETKYLNSKKHLLWIDIPLHNKFFEKQNKQKSYYNETEIEVIDKILKDMNESCKCRGERQEVAVITFYGAQARLLQKEFISKNRYENLKLRVGTVDRFQGIEREIVIVSFVRNNNKGNIGFAKDPKRINVALSRAQNLLVIVGCSELFCEKNFYTNARSTYRNVLKTVDSYNGIIDANEIFN